MRYNQARQMAQAGCRIQRSGWNCAQRYVYFAGKILTLRCRQGRLQTYLPSGEDQQATDWELLR